MSGIPDQRRHLRQQVRSLTYIDLGQDNGGIVLNISEGGLAVQAAAILTGNHFPHMRIKLPGSGEWLEASGEITWTSESGKEAGVRFVDISDDARFQIRQWVSAGGTAGEFREERGRRADRGREVLAAPGSGAIRDTTPESFTPELVRRQQIQDSVSGGTERGEEASRARDTGAMKNMTPESAASEVVVRQQMRDPAPDHIINSVRVARMLSGETDYGSFGSLVEKRDHQGWLLAVVFAILALISLVAGMAVGRGGLSEMLGKLSTQGNIPAAQSPEEPPPPSSAAQEAGPSPSDSTNSTNSDVSQIEVVDTSNRRWLIPLKGAASKNGAASADAAGAGAPSSIPPGSSASSSAEPTAAEPSGGATSAPDEKTENPPQPDAKGSASKGSVPIPREAPKRAPREANVTVRIWILSPAIPLEKVGQPIYRVDPIYPPEAAQQRIEGTVKLRAIIGRDGTVQSVGLVDGPPLLVPAAMDAVRSWRNQPTLLNGEAVELEEQIQIEFHLPE
ncbi:MAG: TonB family protein [Candidatus Acidiferrales bacterium]